MKGRGEAREVAQNKTEQMRAMVRSGSLTYL
jgi:hypothetical protein